MAGHVPVRMCVACRQRFPKAELQRHIRPDGGPLTPDESGKAPGRGCYVCSAPECREKFAKKSAKPKARA